MTAILNFINNWSIYSDSMAEKKLGNQPFAFVLITVLIDAIGFGLIIPVMPELLKQLIGDSSEIAVKWGGYLTFVYAAMHFLFGPLIGNLSDRFGRRPILLASLGALVVDYLIMGFANSIWVLFVGRLLAGICGATYPTANAYIADTTTQEQRAQAFGMMGASFGIGFILGPALGGLLGSADPRTPFFVAAGLALVNMLYGWLILPESLADSNRRDFSLSRANPLGAFAHFGRLPQLRMLFVVSLVYSFAHLVYPSTWNFHADARYGWGASQIGWSLMAFGICSAVIQGGLIGSIIKRIGEFRTAVVGLTVNIISFVGFAYAQEPWMLYCWIPISACGAIAGPSINSIMSSRVGPEGQGELQGAIASVSAIANMLGPLMMTQTFSWFSREELETPFFGGAFLLACLLTAIALAIFCLQVKEVTGESQNPKSSQV